MQLNKWRESEAENVHVELEVEKSCKVYCTGRLLAIAVANETHALFSPVITKITILRLLLLSLATRLSFAIHLCEAWPR